MKPEEVKKFQKQKCQDLLRLLEKNPAKIEVWYELGITYAELGEKVLAKNAFYRAYTLDPSSDIAKEAIKTIEKDY